MGYSTVDTKHLRFVFDVHRALLAALPYQCKLWSKQYDLCGLEQCVVFGPNTAVTPPLSPSTDLCRWQCWKKHTLLICATSGGGAGGSTPAPGAFCDEAMFRYITAVQDYLRVLGVLGPASVDTTPTTAARIDDDAMLCD